MTTRKMHIILLADATHADAEALRGIADSIDQHKPMIFIAGDADVQIAWDDGTIYVMEDGPRKALTYTLPDGRTVTEQPFSFPEEDEGGE